MGKALLPAGFHDLLFPEAGAQANIVGGLQKYFEGYGYSMVNPPVIEFEESLFAGSGKVLENQTFRLMDPLSHKMMGVRADMTVQIARMATTRLKNEIYPLRLSYSGDVFRVKGEGLYAERQFTQAGIELIGVDNANADAEIVAVALDALKNVGAGGLCIDFTIPGLVDILLKEIGVGDSDRTGLLAAIKKKDSGEVSRLAGKKAGLLLKLISPDINIDSLVKLKLPNTALVLCKRLKEVVEILKCKLDGISISIDPLGAVDLSYHSGIGFSIFSRDAKEELGRGGRYVIDGKVSGVGVTLYVNGLFRMLPLLKSKDKVFVPLGTKNKEVKKINEKGMVIINALEKSKNHKKDAKRLGCKYLLLGSKLLPI